MGPAAGLRTHIWNNNLKSLALLAGFPVLLILLAYSGALLWVAFDASARGDADGLSLTRDMAEAATALPRIAPIALAIAGVWFVIAWFFHQRIIDASVGARAVSRTDEPGLYNLLENLAISRGMTMPSLRIIETPARNAYASGLTAKQYTVTVTRGLMDALDEAELEAVLAHELTHIRNRDVRLLVISVIFVGIISFVVEIGARALFRGSVGRLGGARRGRSGNAGVIVLVAIVIVAIAYALALLIRFSLSRRREFMADAGAVELTKNPDAMISALRKVSGRPDIEDAPREVRQMFLHDRSTGFAGLFATHPPLEQRIAALVEHAGGRDAGAQPPPGSGFAGGSSSLSRGA